MICHTTLAVPVPIAKGDDVSLIKLKLYSPIQFLPYNAAKDSFYHVVFVSQSHSSKARVLLEKRGFILITIPAIDTYVECSNFVDESLSEYVPTFIRSQYNSSNPVSVSSRRIAQRFVKHIDKFARGLEIAEASGYTIMLEPCLSSVITSFFEQSLSKSEQIARENTTLIVDVLQKNQKKYKKSRSVIEEGISFITEAGLKKVAIISLLKKQINTLQEESESAARSLSMLDSQSPATVNEIERFRKSSRFDVLLINKNCEPILAVEFDGRTHDKPSVNDKKKDWLCCVSGLPLVRIPYGMSPFASKYSDLEKEQYAKRHHRILECFVGEILLLDMMGFWMPSIATNPFEVSEQAKWIEQSYIESKTWLKHLKGRKQGALDTLKNMIGGEVIISNNPESRKRILKFSQNRIE